MQHKAIAHIAKNGMENKKLTENMDEYNIDANVSKVRIAYATYTGE